ncbi:MAG TPA: imidazole glycerol phosphate synthase subunit HisH [Pyrinomonadaceae bacterium]|jgi:imidazole glycerol-phosphate synthase subunit HisH|nr:imidazole glycerol phosphate synthase subunit HisH [Pyrinomonadaceae bacterium]
MLLTVAIVDYGTGNLHSVIRSLNRLGTNGTVASNSEEILRSDKIILPGVGHFGRAMQRMQSLGLVPALNHAVLVDKKPILGICLGMELMAKRGEEGDSEGLGWFNGEIVRFRIKNELKYKVPHIGWNQIHISKDSRLMKDIPEASEFYFLHSFHFAMSDRSSILNETEYEYTFPSAIEKDNIFGVQYHPEKSHDLGVQLLKNFLDL